MIFVIMEYCVVFIIDDVEVRVLIWKDVYDIFLR